MSGCREGLSFCKFFVGEVWSKSFVCNQEFNFMELVAGGIHYARYSSSVKKRPNSSKYRLLALRSRTRFGEERLDMKFCSAIGRKKHARHLRSSALDTCRENGSVRTCFRSTRPVVPTGEKLRRPRNVSSMS